MASEAPERSQNDNRDDTKILADEDESLTTSFDEVYDYDSFDAMMGLQENLLRGIYAYRFEKPSPSEQREIDPLVHQAPTRELALQIEKVIEALSDYLGVKKERMLETQARLINISTQTSQKRFNHEFFRCQLSKRAPLPTRLRKSGFREAIKQPRKKLH